MKENKKDSQSYPKGAWSFASDIDKIKMEDGAWAQAAVKKHLLLLEEMKKKR